MSTKATIEEIRAAFDALPQQPDDEVWAFRYATMGELTDKPLEISTFGAALSQGFIQGVRWHEARVALEVARLRGLLERAADAMARVADPALDGLTAEIREALEVEP